MPVHSVAYGAGSILFRFHIVSYVCVIICYICVIGEGRAYKMKDSFAVVWHI